jgi:serine/threonine protein kinase
MPTWFLPWYELILDTGACVGEGGFGSVYRAKWLDSEVVVKQVKVQGKRTTPNASKAISTTFESTFSADRPCTSDDAERQKLRKMFECEVGIWFDLSHPHIVRLFGACHLSTPFFACEFATNGPLDKYLRTHPDELWPKLFEDALDVQYLQVRGVIHGDLKCNNVVVGSDGKGKVTDFALSATAALAGNGGERVSAAWQRVAPECLQEGAAQLSSASDIYALGMCIVESRDRHDCHP